MEKWLLPSIVAAIVSLWAAMVGNIIEPSNAGRFGEDRMRGNVACAFDLEHDNTN